MKPAFIILIIAIAVLIISVFITLAIYFGWHRYIYLSCKSAESFDRVYDKLPRVNTDSQVIVSLTSIPSRIDHIKPVINSILDQNVKVDKIVINLPKKYRRFEKELTIPDFIKNCQNIHVDRINKDYGPITKLLPTLAREKDDTKIIYVDDDMIYGKDFVETMIAYSDEHPNNAICNHAWSVKRFLDHNKYDSKDGRKDVAEGFAAVLVKPKFFTEDIYNILEAPESAFFSDDIWISGHLAKNGIEIIVTKYNKYYNTLLIRKDSLLYGPNKDNKNTKEMIRYFGDYWKS
jgi:hypothetical protein